MFAPVHPDCILTAEKTKATKARNEKRKSKLDTHVSQSKEALESQLNSGKERLEKRKSQLNIKLNHGKEAIEKRKSQLDSKINHGLDRIDRRVDQLEARINKYKERLERHKSKIDTKIDHGKVALEKRKSEVEAQFKHGKKVVGTKVNNGLNWFFAIGTTEDETGQVIRRTADHPAKKVIKTVRFEELTVKDQLDLKIAHLERIKHRQKKKSKKALAKIKAINEARENERRAAENKFYERLQVQDYMMSGALNDEEDTDDSDFDAAVSSSSASARSFVYTLAGNLASSLGASPGSRITTLSEVLNKQINDLKLVEAQATLHAVNAQGTDVDVRPRSGSWSHAASPAKRSGYNVEMEDETIFDAEVLDPVACSSLRNRLENIQSVYEDFVGNYGGLPTLVLTPPTPSTELRDGIWTPVTAPHVHYRSNSM